MRTERRREFGPPEVEKTNSNANVLRLLPTSASHPSFVSHFDASRFSSAYVSLLCNSVSQTICSPLLIPLKTYKQDICIENESYGRRASLRASSRQTHSSLVFHRNSHSTLIRLLAKQVSRTQTLASRQPHLVCRRESLFSSPRQPNDSRHANWRREAVS